MEFTVTDHQICNVIKITGRIDSYTSPKITKTIQKLIKEGHHNFVMNLNEVNFLSSSGILMFVNLQKQLTKQKDGKIIFSEVPDLIYSSFKLAGFDKFFEFYNNTNTAIRRF